MSRAPFIAFAAANVLSISGTRLSTIAIPWLVLTATGSPVLTGLVAMGEMLPFVIAKALSGPLIDRIGAKRIAVTSDIASALAVTLIPLFGSLDMLVVEVLLPIVVAMGVLRGPADAAKTSMVPDIAAMANVPLTRVTGVAGIIERLASTVGAGVAGGLVALIGPSPALLVNAATFALAALIVAVGIPAARRSERGDGVRSSYFAEFLEGFDFIRKDAVLVGMVGMITVTNLLDQATAVILMPVWIIDAGYDAALLGLFFAVFSGASIGGAGIATMVGERLPRFAVYVVAFMLAGLPRFIVFALDAPLAMILVTLGVSGFASGFLNPIIIAVVFERIPKPLVGRVSSLTFALCWALIPFGGLFGGTLVTALGLAAAYWITGTSYLAATLLPLARRSFRAFGERPVDSVI